MNTIHDLNKTVAILYHKINNEVVGLYGDPDAHAKNRMVLIERLKKLTSARIGIKCEECGVDARTTTMVDNKVKLLCWKCDSAHDLDGCDGSDERQVSHCYLLASVDQCSHCKFKF